MLYRKQRTLSRRNALCLLASCLAFAPAKPGLAPARAQQPPAPPPTAADRPDVVMIAVDDLNDWVGVLGRRTDVKTPNIDRLAKRGVLFTRAYCPAPVCNASRAALMTGVLPSASGVYENNQPWRPVLKDVVTLPQYFMAHGYDVQGAGKIYHNSYNDAASWHRHFNTPPHPQPPKKSASGLGSGHLDWSPVDARDEDMGDYKVVSWGIERLAEKRDKPLFLAVGLIRPHLPWYAPRKYFEMYPLDKIKRPEVREGDLDDVPAEGKRLALRLGDHAKVTQAGQWEKAVQGYLASITFADAQIGRLLDAIEKSPRADSTIIVLWSDHGWNLGEKQHWRKFALWEETTRVTFAVVAPGVTPVGAACARPVSLMDVYPTLAELCRLPEKKGIAGVSLVPLLKDPARAWDRPALMTYERGNHAVRSERYRYIRYRQGGEELYDHQSDPREWKNLAGDPAMASVKKELAGWLPKTDAPDAPTRAGGGRTKGGKAAKPQEK